jgi:hypothetical protein
LVLEDVQAGSIKATLKNLISEVPDEALKNADWKKIVGHFLVKAKYLILRWCEERDAIDSRQDVKGLQEQLLAAAEETDIKLFPAYSSMQPTELLADIKLIQESLAPLQEGDKVTFTGCGESVVLNENLILSEELVRDLLTREVVDSNSIQVIQVKKPDYLGRSQWSFRYDGHKIEASIQDKEWLGKFQTRLVDVRPGDSLKVDLHEQLYMGYDGEIVHRYYLIDYVIEVIKPPLWRQSDIFED